MPGPFAEEIFGTAAAGGGAALRTFTAGTVSSAAPALQLLSNGRYQVMLTSDGAGYSRCNGLALTRWREDATRDNWGAFCYVRDVASGRFWSCSRQPAPHPTARYQASFWDGGVVFDCHADDLDSRMEVVVAAADDVEIRRLTLVNRGATGRLLDLTTYAEVVLAAPAADDAHPAFSNLFVETEILPAQQAILCTRRSGSVAAGAPWMFHLVVAIDTALAAVSYETDRVQFIGRGRSLVNPRALQGDAGLSGSQGSVLDPVAALRCRLALGPRQAASVAFITGAGHTRAACLALIEKYRSAEVVAGSFGLAWSASRQRLRQLQMDRGAVLRSGLLADAIIYANAALRADPAVVLKNQRGQSGLWGLSISGDWPIVLLQIGVTPQPELVRPLLQAHAYWRAKGLQVDLVICNAAGVAGRQQLQQQVRGWAAADTLDQPGGVFVRLAPPLAEPDLILLQSVARVVLDDGAGPLADQLARRHRADIAAPPPQLRMPPPMSPPMPTPAQEELLFFNGMGGFSRDGREYVVRLAPGQETPLPWVNVLANPSFGSLVSESGGASSWSGNAQEFRLTPWTNDVISDMSGEAFYVRDEQSGACWSPTPWPRRGAGHYVCRHGFGYSRFTHTEQGIRTELRVFVARRAPLKFAVLTVRNESNLRRRLSVTGYVEWVLGEAREKSMSQVVTALDPASGALLARNAYSAEFGTRVAFFDADDRRADACSASCDRTEFIGRNGSLRDPAGMARPRLSGHAGALLDPCAALRIPFELAPGTEREIVFRLGAAVGEDRVRRLAQQFHSAAAAHRELADVVAYWRRTLDTLQVETPEPAFDLLANGWLLYQTLACRLWGRTAFYQSSGAFGFRDQLQDVMALVHAEPELVRAHLLLCASRQFREGDVQHWWHPPAGRGVRTRCSDDFLWLPFAVCRYVTVTGDAAVLEQPVAFLDGRQLHDGEESYYELPLCSGETAPLYQHCVRAIRHGLRFGRHGLPLMGSGDWNDGMNRVGIGGKGESVWLGFFLYDVLTQFAPLARQRADPEFADCCATQAASLGASLERHGWDGAWYRRAYFDDGSVLGSSANAECRIDSIAQSWAVLSGAAGAERARMAMAAVDQQLVRHDGAVLQLLTPPFDRSVPDPGYIQAYVPGVRENGAQYTHAAVWAVMAFAALGDGERAMQLLSMINPVNHATDLEAASRYKLEPYVVASDVYALPPHAGRGGWSWYSGSAGWMLRLMTESILGLRRVGDTLYLEPCIPASWSGFRMRYRYRETTYCIGVMQSREPPVEAAGAAMLIVDGVWQDGLAIALVDDQRRHQVELRIDMPRRPHGGTGPEITGPETTGPDAAGAPPPAAKNSDFT